MPKQLDSGREKPARPEGFPLFAHASGQWAKKVRGRMLYFGPWKDQELALARWNAWKEDLLAGRPVRATSGNEITLKELCNDFLSTKRVMANEGAITQRTWDEYFDACTRLCKILGKDFPVPSLVPADFEKIRVTLSKTWGPVRLGNEIRRMRTIFTHGVAHELLDRLPSYGTSFHKPSKAVLRKTRAAKGPRMFEAGDLQKLLAAASPTMKAMILLGINCGLGNTDMVGLMKKHLDLKKGWVNYPRQKTGIERRGKLWPETIAAIKAVLAIRAKGAGKKAGAGLRKLIFLTKSGRSWKPGKTGDPISQEMLTLGRRCKVWRPGLNFYALRHTFETIGGECGDQPAVNHVMGHPARQDDMSAVYRERMLDTRLEAVAEHVRKWLFGETALETKHQGTKNTKKES